MVPDSGIDLLVDSVDFPGFVVSAGTVPLRITLTQILLGTIALADPNIDVQFSILDGKHILIKGE